MIPFNHLGWIFKYIGPSIYPRKVRESLCSFLIPLSKSASNLICANKTCDSKRAVNNKFFIIPSGMNRIKLTVF